jgi:hypothetical protein
LYLQQNNHHGPTVDGKSNKKVTNDTGQEHKTN